MAVTPADFELYSRATGTPMPRTPQEQMQMAPMVYKYMQSRGYQNPKGFLGQAGDFLAKAALVGGGLALANQLIPYESGGGGGATATEPISTDDDNILTGFSPRGLLPPGRESGQIAVSPVNISPQTPVARGNVGNTGSIKTDLSNAVDRSDVWDGGAAPAVVVAGTRGFGPAPAPRAEAEGLRDIEFSMKPPIQRDPSFFNPTGNWGVGDTANLVDSGIKFAMDYGPTIAEQGALDIAKGARDIQKGIDDVSVVINSVYDAGAATRRLLDSTVASLPTSSSQQSDPVETGDQSILIDHPDVVQKETGSDEVQNNRNYVLQGNVDLEGNLIVDPRNIEDEAEAKKHWEFTHPQRLYTDHREFGVGGGGVNYLNAGNRFAGDPESFGTVPSKRVRDKFISSTGIPQIKDDLVGYQRSPEDENNHSVKQFLRGFLGQDSPVEYDEPTDNKEDVLLTKDANAGVVLQQDPGATVNIDGREYPANSLQDVKGAGGALYTFNPDESRYVRGIVTYPKQGSERSGTMDFYLNPYRTGDEAPPNLYSQKVPKWLQRTITPLLEDGSLQDVLKEDYNAGVSDLYNRLQAKGKVVNPRYAGELMKSGPSTINVGTGTETFPNDYALLNASQSGGEERAKALRSVQGKVERGLNTFIKKEHGDEYVDSDKVYLSRKKDLGETPMIQEVTNEALRDKYTLHPRQFVGGGPGITARFGADPDPWL